MAGLSAMEYPYWMMVTGAVLVILGFIRFVLVELDQAPIENEGEGCINVTQRADASHKIGKLKSKMAYRSFGLSALVLNALREWKLV